ncbi:MAG TPA: cytochrome c [Opitutaceae bacterium]|nr:cytochrome c [Opitutaceae bacterium]
MRLFVIIVIAFAVLAAVCARVDTSVSSDAPAADGAALYAQHCATCHMADGKGVPSLQPSLVDSAIVRGDESLLIRVVLVGPAAVLPADREPYNNTMAGFAMLADAEVAALLTYVRREFGNGAAPVSTERVAAVRAAP